MRLFSNDNYSVHLCSCGCDLQVKITHVQARDVYGERFYVPHHGPLGVDPNRVGTVRTGEYEPVAQQAHVAQHVQHASNEQLDSKLQHETFRNPPLCQGLIPGTFIVCGEGQNYCSEECQLAAAFDDETPTLEWLTDEYDTGPF